MSAGTCRLLSFSKIKHLFADCVYLDTKQVFPLSEGQPLLNTPLINIHRLNYILWAQDLVDTTGDEYRDDYDPDRDVLGLDMYVLI